MNYFYNIVATQDHLNLVPSVSTSARSCRRCIRTNCSNTAPSRGPNPTQTGRPTKTRTLLPNGPGSVAAGFAARKLLLLLSRRAEPRSRRWRVRSGAASSGSGQQARRRRVAPRRGVVRRDEHRRRATGRRSWSACARRGVVCVRPLRPVWSVRRRAGERAPVAGEHHSSTYVHQDGTYVHYGQERWEPGVTSSGEVVGTRSVQEYHVSSGTAG